MSRIPFSVPFPMVEVSFHKAFSRRGAGKIGGTPQKCEKPYCPIPGPYPVGINLVSIGFGLAALRQARRRSRRWPNTREKIAAPAPRAASRTRSEIPKFPVRS